MPLKVTEKMIQVQNGDWEQYTSAEEMLQKEQYLSGVSIDSACEMVEELDPNVFKGRKNEILEVVKNTVISFDAEAQMVTKVRVWPDRECYDIYRSDLWDEFEISHPGKGNYTKVTSVEEI